LTIYDKNDLILQNPLMKTKVNSLNLVNIPIIGEKIEKGKEYLIKIDGYLLHDKNENINKSLTKINVIF
jgi:hypothetical protein